MNECPKCGEKAVKYGKRKGKQRYQCRKGHLFTLEKPSGEHGSPSPEPQPQPQPQDIAMEIIRESEKPQPEQKPEPEPKREFDSKVWNSPLIIGEGIGNIIGDLLNKIFFKPKEKEKTEQEEDFI